MKTILCFGDSNTWGSIASDRPTVQPSLRYDEHTRWPCVLGEELGPEYRVVEEGLSGRTTIYSIPSEAPALPFEPSSAGSGDHDAGHQ